MCMHSMCTCACMRTFVCVHMCVHMCVHACAHLCMHTFGCVHVHVFFFVYSFECA